MRKIMITIVALMAALTLLALGIREGQHLTISALFEEMKNASLILIRFL